MSTAVTTFTGVRSDEITNTLARYEEQIARALPKTAGDLNAKRIIQIAGTIIARDEKLRACERGSVVAAVMQAAILGLNPLPQLAEVYFVPFKSRQKNDRGQWENGPVLCTIQIGYRGWVKNYHRNPLIREVYAEVVREGDEFECTRGLHRNLVHNATAPVGANDGTGITHAYAIAHYTNGGFNFVVLSKKELEQLRARGADGQAWKNDYAAMAMAKAFKQLRRGLPPEGSIDAAYAADERVYTADAISDDGSGVRLETLEAAEAVQIAEVAAPKLLDGLTPGSNLTQGDDVANELEFETRSGAGLGAAHE